MRCNHFTNQLKLLAYGCISTKIIAFRSRAQQVHQILISTQRPSKNGRPKTTECTGLIFISAHSLDKLLQKRSIGWFQIQGGHTLAVQCHNRRRRPPRHLKSSFMHVWIWWWDAWSTQTLKRLPGGRRLVGCFLGSRQLRAYPETHSTLRLDISGAITTSWTITPDFNNAVVQDCGQPQSGKNPEKIKRRVYLCSHNVLGISRTCRSLAGWAGWAAYQLLLSFSVVYKDAMPPILISQEKTSECKSTPILSTALDGMFGRGRQMGVLQWDLANGSR